MSGFAGSDRGGVRRRRLAVEVEGTDANVPLSSGSGDSLERFFASSGKEAGSLVLRECPIVNVVSAQAWKHWAAVAAMLACGVGLLVAGYSYHAWAGNLGPGIPRLLKPSTSPVVAWFNSIILFVAAQLTCLIFWARSRSLRDFGGRYRIWGWAAATWLFLSFAVATHAHVAWSETVLFYFPWRSPGAAMWCWLVPASIWGWALALRLEEDMREDRPGYWVLLLACFCHLGAVSLYCQREFWPGTMTLALNQLLFSSVQLLGHLTLLLSMSLHARHVLYFSAEPPPGKRRSSGARSRETTPVAQSLFQRLMPTWVTGVKMPSAGPDDADDDEAAKKTRKKTTPKKRSTARKTSRRSKASESDSETLPDGEYEEGTETSEMAEEVAATGKKNYRVDKPA